MKKDARIQPEYLIESDYIIFHGITRLVYQTWIALSVLVLVFGSYNYTSDGIISAFLLKFSAWIASATPLVDRVALARPRSDATRVILSLVILLIPLEIARIARVVRRAADGARNKSLLMKKLCGDKITVASCFLFAVYRGLFFMFLPSLLLISQVCDCGDSGHDNFWDNFYDIMVSSTLGVEFVLAFLVSGSVYFISTGFVAVSYLMREQFQSQKGR